MMYTFQIPALLLFFIQVMKLPSYKRGRPTSVASTEGTPPSAGARPEAPFAAFINETPAGFLRGLTRSFTACLPFGVARSADVPTTAPSRNLLAILFTHLLKLGAKSMSPAFKELMQSLSIEDLAVCDEPADTESEDGRLQWWMCNLKCKGEACFPSSSSSRSS